jgi:hypothetical protein
MRKDFASPEDLQKAKISYLAEKYKIDTKTAHVARQLALANNWRLIIGKTRSIYSPSPLDYIDLSL